MRIIVLLALAVMLAGCGTTKTSEAVIVGTPVDTVYVRDAKTGKCIKITWFGGKITELRLASPYDCQDK